MWNKRMIDLTLKDYFKINAYAAVFAVACVVVLNVLDKIDKREDTED